MHDAARPAPTAFASSTHGQGSDPVRNEAPPPLRALAHELNSLLDGSLRTLRLTRRAMTLGEPTPETVAATRDLEAVELAMVRMSDALARVLAAPAAPSTGDVVSAFTDNQPLAETARQVVRSLSSTAEECGVTVRLECDPSAAQLTTGPLEPLLRNTIRNAIEACARAPDASVAPVVSVSIRRRGDRLLVDVLDNGPGLRDDPRPAGHGVGLTVAREIVASVRGSFELSNVPFGRGALVRADLPALPFARSRAA